MRVLIVDDEAPARRKVARMLRRHDNVEIVGEAADAAQAVDMIRALRPGVVFLDVQMPGADGFSVVEAIAGDARAPRIVFVTAHDRYAVRAFDVCAADYLLKPFDEERFDRALERVGDARPEQAMLAPQRLRELLDAFRGPTAYSERLLVPGEDRSFFVNVAEIQRVEAARNSVVLYCANRQFTLRTTTWRRSNGGWFRASSPVLTGRISCASTGSANWSRGSTASTKCGCATGR